MPLKNELIHTYCYGGFWRRLVALFIDFVAMLVPLFILTTALRASLVALIDADTELVNTANSILTTSFWWLYFAGMNSSSWQASVGKRALGMKIVGRDGERISFTRASVRFFAEYLSLLPLFIGFFMAGWTQRKQSLHDLIVKTYVVRTDARILLNH